MRKISQALITGAAALSLVGAATGVTLAETDSPSSQACHLRADVPNSKNNARVGRADCSNKLDGRGLIKEDRFGPDDNVGETSGSGWGVKWVYGSCGNGRGSYYSYFKSSSGATTESTRATRC